MAIRASSIRAADSAMRPLVAGATLELIPMKSLERAIGELRPGSRISMTCSPAKSIAATLDEAARLLDLGHTVVPHLAARMVESDEHLAAIHGCVRELGLREIFVVAGDAPETGCFHDAIEFIEALIDLDDRSGERRAIDHIGVTAYPESHPLIPDDKLHDALHRKQELILSTGRTAHASTQMCFSSDTIVEWIRRERAAGLTVPVHLGVPGVIDRTKLLATGMRLGIGTSLRYLSKNRRALGRLMTRSAFTPDSLLKPFAGRVDELGISGLHVFTFNQVDATEVWRERVLS